VGFISLKKAFSSEYINSEKKRVQRYESDQKYQKERKIMD